MFWRVGVRGSSICRGGVVLWCCWSEEDLRCKYINNEAAKFRNYLRGEEKQGYVTLHSNNTTFWDHKSKFIIVFVTVHKSPFHLQYFIFPSYLESISCIFSRACHRSEFQSQPKTNSSSVSRPSSVHHHNQHPPNDPSLINLVRQPLLY